MPCDRRGRGVALRPAVPFRAAETDLQAYDGDGV